MSRVLGTLRLLADRPLETSFWQHPEGVLSILPGFQHTGHTWIFQSCCAHLYLADLCPASHNYPVEMQLCKYSAVCLFVESHHCKQYVWSLLTSQRATSLITDLGFNNLRDWHLHHAYVFLDTHVCLTAAQTDTILNWLPLQIAFACGLCSKLQWRCHTGQIAEQHMV